GNNQLSAVSLFRNSGFLPLDWRYPFLRNSGTPAQEYPFFLRNLSYLISCCGRACRPQQRGAASRNRTGTVSLPGDFKYSRDKTPPAERAGGVSLGSGLGVLT